MTADHGNRFTKYFPLLLDALRSADPAPMHPADAIAWIRDRIDVEEHRAGNMRPRVVFFRQRQHARHLEGGIKQLYAGFAEMVSKPLR